MGLSTRRKNSCEGRNSNLSGIYESLPGYALIPCMLWSVAPCIAILEVDRDGLI